MESMDMESEKLFGEGLEVKTAPLRAKETTSRESILSARNASRYQFVLMNKNETGSGMGGATQRPFAATGKKYTFVVCRRP